MGMSGRMRRENSLRSTSVRRAMSNLHNSCVSTRKILRIFRCSRAHLLLCMDHEAVTALSKLPPNVVPSADHNSLTHLNSRAPISQRVTTCSQVMTTPCCSRRVTSIQSKVIQRQMCRKSIMTRNSRNMSSITTIPTGWML